jgi:hypothetical protein
MDYSEVSGQMGGGKINQNKPKGMKANSDVFKKASEFFKRLYES